MTDHFTPGPANSEAALGIDEPLLVEDVMLLLFQPDSGTIAGETILYYVLGGAVLGDLTLMKRIEVRKVGALTSRVFALEAAATPDSLLAPSLRYIEEKPRNVQTVLAAIGPNLRAPVLDRIVERGDITREQSKMFGIFSSTKLIVSSDRRAQLIRRARAVLVDGKTPDARTAASIALLSASGTLPQFDREIPWSGDVSTRAKAIEHGDWGAAAAGSAVTRTMTAMLTDPLFAALASPRT